MITINDLSGINLTIVLFAILLLEIGILTLGYKFIETRKAMIEYKMEYLNTKLTYEFDYNIEEIEERLDKFIANVFYFYIFTYKYNTINTTISQEEEVNMYKEVTQVVFDLMSIPFLTQLSMIYDRDEIHQIINYKVIVVVSSYCGKANNTIPDK